MILEVTGLILFVILFNTLFGSYKNNSLLCGIVGFSGTKNFNLTHIKFLLYWNSIERGKDSTGIYTPNNGIIKDIKTAGEYIQTTAFCSLKLDKTLISHVRAKTVGLNTVENAHPWEFKNIVGLHNGSLTGYHQLATKYSYPSNEWGVDSQVLLKAVDINFDNNELFKVLGEYEGAAALMMYHKERNTIFVCHDSKRPLWYGYIDKTEMYISSIPAPLHAIGCKKIKEFDVNTVYEIQAGKIINTLEYVPLDSKPGNIKLANKANIIEVLNENKEIINYEFDENIYTGIDFVPLINKMLVGYNLRYDSNGSYYNDSGKFIKGNAYFVCGIGAGVHATSTISVIDEKGEKISTYLSRFDYKNFIPVKGGYVTALVPVYFTKTNKLACAKGDVLKVIEHIYGTDKVKVYDEYTQKTFYIPLDLLVVSSKEEIESHELTLSYSLDNSTDNPSCNLPVLLNDPKDGTFEDLFKDDQDSDDTYVDGKVVKDLLKFVKSKLDAIGYTNPDGTINKDVDQLNSFIKDCEDLDYIDETVEIYNK